MYIKTNRQINKYDCHVLNYFCGSAILKVLGSQDMKVLERFGTTSCCLSQILSEKHMDLGLPGLAEEGSLAPEVIRFDGDFFGSAEHAAPPGLQCGGDLQGFFLFDFEDPQKATMICNTDVLGNTFFFSFNTVVACCWAPNRRL